MQPAPARRRLRKRQPSTAESPASDTSSLRRTPSEPSRSVKSSLEHTRKHNRSETSPNAAPPIGAASLAAYALRDDHLDSSSPNASQRLHQRYSLRQKPSNELLGQRFDSAAIIHNFENIIGQQSAPRAPELLHQHSDITGARPTHPPTARAKDIVANPEVRLSESLAATGRKMEDVGQGRSPMGGSNNALRNSKEKSKNPLKGLFDGLSGTQRRPAISAPENPVHVTHVGYDQNTGEFTVCITPDRKSVATVTDFAAR